MQRERGHAPVGALHAVPGARICAGRACRLAIFGPLHGVAGEGSLHARAEAAVRQGMRCLSTGVRGAQAGGSSTSWQASTTLMLRCASLLPGC